MGPRTYYPFGGGIDMSEGERMAMDCMDEYDAHDPETYEEQAALERLEHMEAPKGIWNSTEGEVPIRRMTDGHLKNAIRWLRKYRLDGTPKGLELYAEQERRATLAKKSKKARGAWPPAPGSLRRSDL